MMMFVLNNQLVVYLIVELGLRFICYYEFWSCFKFDYEIKKFIDLNLLVVVFCQVYCCIDVVFGVGYC